MKSFIISILFITIPYVHFAQNCMDAIILSKDSKTDTISCKIIDITDIYYTVDYGNEITSIAKTEVLDTLMCYRTMTLKEIERYKGLDAVSGFKLDDGDSKTPGRYIRKASYNFYTGFGVAAVGGLALGLGCNVKSMNTTIKNVCIISGSIATAIGAFFVLKGCHHIYQAGKLLDLERAAVYLEPTKKGDLGLILKF